MKSTDMTTTEVRKESIRIALSRSEKKNMEEAAQRMGLPVSLWARVCLIDIATPRHFHPPKNTKDNME